jgi:hypothetical protein
MTWPRHLVVEGEDLAVIDDGAGGLAGGGDAGVL